MPIRVIAEAEVRPTENPNKVRKAISNVFTPSRYSVIREGEWKIIRAEGYGSSSLLRLHRLLRVERILDAARQYMKSGVIGNKIIFKLHKQAALMGIVSFCDDEINSPLGAIRFEIECDDPKALIDWLAPRTHRGSPIREYPPPD
ncbi:MAG: hypothetical protein J7L11_10965 [Thermoprotei archaeon]|nr:hypothetical protein [Thermoprotei archaeon]